MAKHWSNSCEQKGKSLNLPSESAGFAAHATLAAAVLAAAFCCSCGSESEQPDDSAGGTAAAGGDPGGQTPMFRLLPGDGVDSPAPTPRNEVSNEPRGSNDLEYEDFLETTGQLRNTFSGNGGSSFVPATAPTVETDAGSDASSPATEHVDAGLE